MPAPANGKEGDDNIQALWRRRLTASRNLPAVLKIIWNSGPSVVLADLAFRLIATAIPIGMLAISRLIVDGVSGISHGVPRPEHFWWWVGGEFTLACLAAIVARVILFFDTLVGDRFSRYLSTRVMEHAARLDLASYEDPVFLDRLERARVQAMDRVGMLRSMGDMLQQGTLALGFCLTVLSFSPWLLLVLVTCLLPAFFGESYFAFRGYTLGFEQTPVKREIDYLRILGAGKESAKEFKLFGLAQYFGDRFQKLWNIIYLQDRALARQRLWLGTLFSLLTAGGYYSCYVWVIWQAVQGKITLGTMTFLAGSIAGASTNLQSLFTLFSAIADQALFLTDLVLFFQQEPRIHQAQNPIPAPRPIREGFSFQNVSFHYEGSTRLVLDSLNFQIEPGQTVALVGQNGQGKTTIVKLLTRLYDPTSGRILLDGIDLREYDAASLTSQIAVIFQDFMRYDLTVRENIGVGQVSMLTGEDHQDEIVRAAEKSLASAVIRRLPKGYDQLLGRRFAKGMELSGGEWQKLALARAYLREAQVLVLDEPTAALDAQSELEVFERLCDLSRDRIALLISHRFSTVRMAHRILVLESGRIAEEGSHLELMELSGRYAKMFMMQAASYR